MVKESTTELMLKLIQEDAFGNHLGCLTPIIKAPSFPIKEKFIGLLSARYRLNKSLPIGESLWCPTCGGSFLKNHVTQVFCRNGERKSSCKDIFWGRKQIKKHRKKILEGI